MREEILDYLRGLKLKTFAVSNELPFSNSGTVMYLKNPKKIYVDETQITVDQFLPVLSGQISSETHTTRVYFSSDAKLQPSDYASIVSLISQAKDLPIEGNWFRRESATSTTYENDLMLTEFEFRYTKLS